MKIEIAKGVLEAMTKLNVESLLTGQVEEKYKVVKLTAVGTTFKMDSFNLLTKIRSTSKDVIVSEEGSVQVDLEKLAKLAGQVVGSAVIETTGTECRVTSGSAVWRLKVHNYEGAEVPFEPIADMQSIRSDSFKSFIPSLRMVLPSETDKVLDTVKMLALVGDSGYGTNMAWLVKTKITPPLDKEFYIPKRVVELILRFLSVTGVPEFKIAAIGDKSYRIIVGMAEVEVERLPGSFPFKNVAALLSEAATPWFTCRVADIKEALSRSMVTVDVMDPKVKILPQGGKLVLEAEDLEGNKGSVDVAAVVADTTSLVMRAELFENLVEFVEGETIAFSFVPNRFVKVTADNLVAAIMISEQKGPKSAGTGNSKK